jgi:hypothetical protein
MKNRGYSLVCLGNWVFVMCAHPQDLKNTARPGFRREMSAWQAVLDRKLTDGLGCEFDALIPGIASLKSLLRSNSHEKLQHYGVAHSVRHGEAAPLYMDSIGRFVSCFPDPKPKSSYETFHRF